MQPPEILTFDCYGTLINWEEGISVAFRQEAARQGLDLDRERLLAAYGELEPEVEAERYRSYREVLGETARRVAMRMGWPAVPDRNQFLAASLGSWPPFPDTHRALERLASKFRLAILSNIDEDLLAGSLAHFPAPFDWTVTAEKVRSYKPASAHFEAAIRRAGGRERILHVCGSIFHDVAPARHLGLKVVWVDRKSEGIPAGGPRPDFRVADLLELADRLGVP